MILMINDRIISAFDQIVPDDSADERMLLAILKRNQRMYEIKKNRHQEKKTVLAAAFVLLIAVAAGIIGYKTNWLGSNTAPNNGDAGFGEDIDGTILPGGSLPEGMDPIVASLAVFPEGETLVEVADARLDSLSQKEAYDTEISGKHLPEFVPDGYEFRHAGLYTTTMKNGMIYYMLSVSYSSGESVHDDSSEDVVDTLDYSVSMWSFTPKTESEVFSINALPDDLSGKGLIYVLYDDVYIGIDAGDLSHNQIVSVLNSIQ